MRATAVLGLETIEGRTLVDTGLAHDELGRVGILLFRIGDRALEHDRDEGRTALLREIERNERLVDALAADQVRDEARLAGRDTSKSVAGLERHGSYLGSDRRAIRP